MGTRNAGKKRRRSRVKSRKLQLSVIGLCSLTAITIFSGCALLKQKPMAFSVPDYVELPAGTVIKDVPFYVNGKDQPPTKMDYTVETEGAFFSGPAQEVLKK
jgi:hypothetical protein